MFREQWLILIALTFMATDACAQVLLTPQFSSPIGSVAYPGSGGNWSRRALVAHDFDADGRDEVVVAGVPLTVFDYSPVTTSFTSNTFPTGAFTFLDYPCVGDIDGANGEDIVFLGNAGGIRQIAAVFGDGNGGLSNITNVSPGVMLNGVLNSPFDIALDDHDNDGDNDLLIVDQTGVWVMLNNGSGGMGSLTLVLSFAGLPVSVIFQEILIVDIDLNGENDIVLSSLSGRIDVHLKSAGAFAQTTYFIPAPFSNSILRVGDVDGDSHPDVMTGAGHFLRGILGGPPTLLSGNGVSFGLSASYLVFDLDSDGDIDYLRTTGGLTTLENDGTGAFFDPRITVTASSAREAVAADFDGDGDKDVIVSGLGSPALLEVFRNDTPQGVAAFPGSGGDVELLSGVNGFPNGSSTKTVSPGDLVVISVASLGGTFSNQPFALLAQAIVTNGGYPVPAAPDFYLSLSSLFVVYDGIALAGQGFPGVIGPVGSTFSGLATLAMSGNSLLFQAVLLAPSPLSPFYTSSNAHEIQFM